MGSVFTESISDQLYSLLDKYCCSMEGVLGAGISTADGLEISSYFNGAMDHKLVHAVSSNIYTQAKNSAKRMGFKHFNKNLTYTDEGIIALQKISDNILLTVLLKSDVNVGLVQIKMDKFVEQVRKLI